MKKTALLLTTLLIFSVACKKTVESEARKWKLNIKRIETLSVEYPAFRGVLDELVKKAEPVMKASEALPVEKDRIKKMAEANAILRAPLVRDLSDTGSLKKEIRTSILKVKGLDLKMNERFSANRAISDADRAMRRVDERLRDPVENLSSAQILSGLLKEELKFANDNLEGIVRQVEKRQKIAREKLEEKEKSAQIRETKKVEAAQPVKCLYCDTLNPADAATCKNCGAPLPKKQ